MYDFVFVTHLPSFYKVNLYNELAKKFNVFVIFVATSSKIRNSDFSLSTFSFDSCILNDGAFEIRSKIGSLYRFFCVLRKIKYKLLVVGGWDLPEFWLGVLLGQKKCNGIVLESSIFDSVHHGIKGMIKKIFLSRCGFAFPSGSPHLKLLKVLNFNGTAHSTYGVGLFNRPVISHANRKAWSGRFLYIGRLSPEKNLPFIISYFKKKPNYSLSIVGDGPEFDELKKDAPANVFFLGYKKNTMLGEIFSNHDNLILPSVSEPWGLVIEEALYFGLPILCSEQVGAAEDLVINLKTGCVFSPLDFNSLDKAIINMENNYGVYLNNVKSIDFNVLKCKQLSAYSDALTKCNNILS